MNYHFNRNITRSNKSDSARAEIKVGHAELPTATTNIIAIAIIIIIIIVIIIIWSTVSGTALVNIGILTATVMAAGRRHSHCCSRRYCVIMGLGAHFPGLHTTRIRVSVSAPTLNLLRRLGRGDPHTPLQITSGVGADARKFGNFKSTHQSALS